MSKGQPQERVSRAKATKNWLETVIMGVDTFQALKKMV